MEGCDLNGVSCQECGVKFCVEVIEGDAIIIPWQKDPIFACLGCIKHECKHTLWVM